MLVELVATGLAAKTMKQKLKAEVAECQAEERLPDLPPSQPNKGKLRPAQGSFHTPPTTPAAALLSLSLTHPLQPWHSQNCAWSAAHLQGPQQ